MILPLYAESQNLCLKRRRFFLWDAEIRAAIAANCRNGRKVDNRKICVKKEEKCYTFLPDYHVKRFFMSSKCLAGLFSVLILPLVFTVFFFAYLLVSCFFMREFDGIPYLAACFLLFVFLTALSVFLFFKRRKNLCARVCFYGMCLPFLTLSWVAGYEMYMHPNVWQDEPYDDDEKICSEKGGVFKTYALRYGTYCDFSGKGKE